MYGGTNESAAGNIRAREGRAIPDPLALAMKFGKRLQQQIEETLPEWQDKFLSYKLLKKRLKLIAAECFNDHAFGGQQQQQQQQERRTSSSDSSGSVNGPGVQDEEALLPHLTVQELEFIRLLNLELEKFNAFFIEKEEEYVIRLQELKERIQRATPAEALCTDEEMLNIWKDLVTFHGEMVLLENYSSLNYTGLVKILKKHDKTTGALLRLPFIRKVLQQPFYMTELLSNLVSECERNLQSLFPWAFLGETVTHSSEPSASTSQQQRDDKNDHGNEVEGIYRSTLAALETIHALRRSSTRSPFSLPPCSRDEENSGVVVDESTVPCVEAP